MAKPTNPIKLAAYLERQAVNSANYRAREKAARTNTAVPITARLQRPANYRPPRVSGNVERAQATAQAQRERRAEVLRGLTDVRNPEVTLRIGEQPKRAAPAKRQKAARDRQSRAIREQSASESVQAVGRARKNQLRMELDNGAQSERLLDSMTEEQRSRFRATIERITAGSQQSIGILFRYAGGQNDFNAALERALASPESRDVEEGLDMLESLAERAEAAAVLYAPKKVGRINV